MTKIYLIFLKVRDPFESKYQLLINGRERVGVKTLKNPKAFIDYSQTVDDVYENLEDYNSTKKMKVLIVFDDMVRYMESNKNLSPIVNEFFLRGIKLNISSFLLYHSLISKCLKIKRLLLPIILS